MIDSPEPAWKADSVYAYQLAGSLIKQYPSITSIWNTMQAGTRILVDILSASLPVIITIGTAQTLAIRFWVCHRFYSCAFVIIPLVTKVPSHWLKVICCTIV